MDIYIYSYIFIYKYLDGRNGVHVTKNIEDGIGMFGTERIHNNCSCDYECMKGEHKCKKKNNQTTQCETQK